MLKVWDIAAATVQISTNNPKLSAVGSNKFISSVNTVAFSPDGKTFLSGSLVGTALFDASTGQVIRFYNTTGSSRVLAFSPNGQAFAVASADQQLSPSFIGNVQIIDVASGNALVTIGQQIGGTTGLAFSPDGLSLATANMQNITLWDVSTGNKIRQFDIHNYVKDQEYATVLAFSPDRLTLVSGGGENQPWHGILKTWKVADASLINTAELAEPVQTITFNHAGNKIAVGSFGKNVYLYDAANLNLHTTYQAATQSQTANSGHLGTINSVAFSADDKTLFSGSRDQSIKQWSVQ